MLELLVQELRSGKEDIYVKLFEEYYVCLCAYSRKYVGRKDIAEDIVSDTFFNIWKNRKEIVIHTSIKSYLYLAVANNSLNYLRKLKREEKLDDYFPDTESGKIGFTEVCENKTDESLLFQELAARIDEAIMQLPAQQKKAFILKRHEKKKNKEIAIEMGISVKTLEMHLTKAMKSLKSKLKDCLPICLF